MMHDVYVLESESEVGQHYVGLTDDLKSRVGKDRPWILKSYFAFRSKEVAVRFERYLKSGSGREFARRHFEEGFDRRPGGGWWRRVRVGGLRAANDRSSPRASTSRCG